jgi:hypothetical protein
MFDYKQRPWSRPLTDEEYDLAVGRKQPDDSVAFENELGKIEALGRDATTRCEIYDGALRNGTMTLDDVRISEGMEPIEP